MSSKVNPYKIMIIGDFSVGKTCAIHRFCDKHYHEFDSTLVCDIKTKLIDLDGDEVYLQIWDTVGQERFNAVSDITYRKIKGILLMYDITNLTSFNVLKNRITYIENNVSCDVVKVLVGNKCDVPEEEREVNFETGLHLANELNIPFFEVSSKANLNIDRAFFMLASNIRKQFKKDESEENIKLDEEEKKRKASESSWCNCHVANNSIFFWR